ncbi:MAG: DNA polymerase IV [Clostridia bacterium]
MTGTIFHIDANSAYLSWEAAYRLSLGEKPDLREIPSVVGGDASKRKGIVLAKSGLAKIAGVHTGQSLFEARSLCRGLVVVPPNYELYFSCSDAMMECLGHFSGRIERFSVDECFMAYDTGDPSGTAYEIKEKIKRELGFTVNVGVSSCKLLAKMASELQKPDRVHTLFREEIPSKMWPLPVEELFMVGSRTGKKLRQYGIETIGGLAGTSCGFLESVFHSHGRMIWEYANGIDRSTVKQETRAPKGIGNSTVTPFDVETGQDASLYILSLSEMVGARLRHIGMMCRTVSVSFRNAGHGGGARQHTFFSSTDSTDEIYATAMGLFMQIWDGQPLRHFGVAVGSLDSCGIYQKCIFDGPSAEKKRKLDRSIDGIRERYGKESLKRASFIQSRINGMNGGICEDYPMMTSLL